MARRPLIGIAQRRDVAGAAGVEDDPVCGLLTDPTCRLEVGDIVDRYDDELPALFSHFVEQIDIIALARDIVEVEFLVFEFRHGLTRRLRLAADRD